MFDSKLASHSPKTLVVGMCICKQYLSLALESQIKLFAQLLISPPRGQPEVGLLFWTLSEF